MNCKSVSEQLIDYIDKALPDERSEELWSHLETCKECRKEYVQLQEIFAKIKKTSDKIPGRKLGDSFTQILEEELFKSTTIEKKHISNHFTRNRNIWQAAAAILLLCAGFAGGYRYKNELSENDQSQQLTEMQSDVNEMKRMMALNLLKDGSASERIKAVNYTEEFISADNDVLDALIETLNSDKNSNVRLAAIYSLARFKSNAKVKNAFLHTLNKQEDPMIQIVIINILVELEEVRAVEELKKLLEKKELNHEVKEHAQNGIKVLI